jgi:isocitrate dehydrogenase (NAD+)
VGGLGLVPGANLGAECAIFEAVHGSAPDIAGKDIANPTALLQSAILMLRYLGEAATADRVQAALEKVYIEKKTLTRDVGGISGTKAFTAGILAALQPPAGPEPGIDRADAVGVRHDPGAAE